jgi:nucleoside-diphosphate-sugar epimerase
VKILVIGASGFLGRDIRHLLLERGHDVGATSRNGRVGGIQLDVTNYRMCESVLTKGHFDRVVNLAGSGVTSGTATEAEMLAVNFRGAETLALVISSMSIDPPRLIHVASSTESEGTVPGASTYGETKSKGSSAVRNVLSGANLPFTIARIHNTYGRHQGAGRFVGAVIATIQYKRPMIIRYPERVRDFCLIDDVAECLVRTVESTELESTQFEIGTGVGTSLWDAAHIVCEAMGDGQEFIIRADPAEVDAFPNQVANRMSPHFVVCKTPLDVGIKSTLGSLR